MAVGIYLYAAGAFCGYWLLRESIERGAGASEGILAATIRGITWLAFAHALAIGISLANALRVKNCDPLGGLTVYLFVAGPAALLGLTFGLLAATLTRKGHRMFLLLIGLSTVSVFLTVTENYFGPRVALHNLVLGQIVLYTYNTSKTIYSTFIWHRVLAGLLCLWFWAFAYFRLAGRGPSPEERVVSRLLLTLTTLFWVVPLMFLSDEWGVTPGNRLVARRLHIALQSPHLVLHYAPEEYDGSYAKRVLAELEWAYAKNAESLDLKLTWKVEAFLYSSASKEELTGGRDVLFAQPWRHRIHITGSINDTILRHELVHTMSADFGRRPYGVPWNLPLIEGLADAVSKDQTQSLETHYETAGALKAGNLP
ncbi:MAG: hypothetical protein ACREJQ_02980, partial [bacterium]